ncbi:unnamed protein product [Blepharisma stoltei]|uniref:Uncharacterized protein n=1 Tax=Blepharisma stoltei TaxID=1481888 RepID=A0AAU9ITX3_9CILI|nr:unnamed protein product [Blepharisma stoltei]
MFCFTLENSQAHKSKSPRPQEDFETDEIAEGVSVQTMPSHRFSFMPTKPYFAQIESKTDDKLEILEAKIKSLKEKNFILKQDLQNANFHNQELQDKLRHYETSNFDPTAYTLRQLNFLLLSKREYINSSFQHKIEYAFSIKVKELEEARERAL